MLSIEPLGCTLPAHIQVRGDGSLFAWVGSSASPQEASCALTSLVVAHPLVARSGGAGMPAACCTTVLSHRDSSTSMEALSSAAQRLARILERPVMLSFPEHPAGAHTDGLFFVAVERELLRHARAHIGQAGSCGEGRS